MKKTHILIALIATLSLLGGCITNNRDISKTKCEEIPQARMTVHNNYKNDLQTIAAAYQIARNKLEKDAQDCRLKVYLENPCEAEWNELQNAYSQARSDISNDNAYNNYKAKKAQWEQCIDTHRSNPDNFYDKGDEKIKKCQETYQAAISEAIKKQDQAKKEAKEKFDKDMTFLNDLEKKCNTPSPSPSPIITTGSGTSTTTSTTTGTTTGTSSSVNSGGGCTIPGENGTPRTGKPDDNVVRDVATEIAVQVAEAITGSPLPTSAINDKIFAGIVCTKLYARLIELQQEEIDAITSGNRREEIKIRRQITRYRRAQQVWCAIAEGRTNSKQVKTAMSEIEKLPSGGELCLLESELKNTEIPNTTIMAVPHAGTYIPTKSLTKFTGDECDGEEHWHIHGEVAALDGQIFTDPNPTNCGLGKTKNLHPVEIEILQQGPQILINS